MMDIARLERHDAADLIARLRHVRLRGHGQPEVYADAAIALETLDVDAIAPAQAYVLNSDLRKVEALADALAARGVDLFDLDGWLELYLDGEDAPIPVLPPVVEESVEPDGARVLILNDGMHRVWTARQRGRSIRVARVVGVSPRTPYYAYALEGGWGAVQVADAPPDVRKRYREPEDHRALFRDFNAVFPGVQARRPHRPAAA